MPVEVPPIFRPDILCPYVDEFTLPPHVEQFRPKLEHWAELIRPERINNFRESEILPSFLHDFFETLLGYAGPASGGTRYTISIEKHVEVEGKIIDQIRVDASKLDIPPIRLLVINIGHFLINLHQKYC